MDIEQKINLLAESFSSNKATNKSYKKIFNLIYTENIINKNNNQFGFSEIPAKMFQKISSRKYKDILIHLYKNDMIFTNIPITKNNTGKDKDGNKITRGYKIDRELIEEKYNINSEKENEFILNYKNAINTINIPITKIDLNINTFEDINIFANEDNSYNLFKIYDYINIDEEAIDYQENTKEYEDVIKKWNSHSEIHQSGYRYFSWFHSLKGRERSFFTINNSYLRECFDIPACNFCILAKMLEEFNIEEKELSKFQRIIKFKYIYKEIADYANIEWNENNKSLIKDSVQHWLNIRKCRFNQGSYKDNYFIYVDDYIKNNFPNIYNTIINWREEEYTNTAGKTKKSKMLWQDYQKIELEIITKLINYLFKIYKVTPVTVHDAVYLTDNDKEKVTEKIEDIFWKIIDLKYTKRILTRSEFEELKTNLSKNEKCFEITEDGYKKYNHKTYEKLLLAIIKHIEIIPDYICEENSEQKELFELFENILSKRDHEKAI